MGVGDVLVGVVVGAVGAMVTWYSGLATKIVLDWRRAARELGAAAFVCLDRLRKIRSAARRSEREQVEAEIYHLGGDLDRYRDCIAAAPERRDKHLRIYGKVMPILLEHDLTSLDSVIGELEDISGLAE
ncbi:MAG: hypothetical protein GTN49_06395 [candidate division Zixibacteria bacterium]|nr:hypothetical protein [candidate division Zixibacteria bacterium]